MGRDGRTSNGKKSSGPIGSTVVVAIITRRYERVGMLPLVVVVLDVVSVNGDVVVVDVVDVVVVIVDVVDVDVVPVAVIVVAVVTVHLFIYSKLFFFFYTFVFVCNRHLLSGKARVGL